MVAAVLLLVTAPIGASGSLDAPEMEDRAGDIDYFPGTDDEGHEYIDILAGYASHDTTNDRINLTLVVHDSRALQEDLGDWRASCDYRIEVQDEGKNATLRMEMEKDGSSAVTFRVILDKNGEIQTVRDEYSAGISYGQPGFLNWSFAAGYLRSLGANATHFEAQCSSLMRAAGAPTFVVHSDDAQGARTYVFPPQPESEAEPFDPADDLPADRKNGTNPSSSSDGKSPALAIPAVLVAVYWVATRRRADGPQP